MILLVNFIIAENNQIKMMNFYPYFDFYSTQLSVDLWVNGSNISQCCKTFLSAVDVVFTLSSYNIHIHVHEGRFICDLGFCFYFTFTQTGTSIIWLFKFNECNNQDQINKYIHQLSLENECTALNGFFTFYHCSLSLCGFQLNTSAHSVSLQSYPW